MPRCAVRHNGHRWSARSPSAVRLLSSPPPPACCVSAACALPAVAGSPPAAAAWRVRRQPPSPAKRSTQPFLRSLHAAANVRSLKTAGPSTCDCAIVCACSIARLSCARFSCVLPKTRAAATAAWLRKAAAPWTGQGFPLARCPQPAAAPAAERRTRTKP